MTCDSYLDILREIRIDGRRRVFRQQGDAFGDGPADRFGRMNHGNGPGIVFDHDLCPRADMIQERSKVADRLRVRDMDDVPSHEENYTPRWSGGCFTYEQPLLWLCESRA